tara:strand:- start:305 stop:502 length:198 start_codon:yes stop_codon:yes gene_type:complete
MGIMNTLKTRWAIKSTLAVQSYHKTGERFYYIFRHWTSLDDSNLPPLEEIKLVTHEELTLYNIRR